MKYSKSFKLFVYQLHNLLEMYKFSSQPCSEEYFIYELMLNLTNYVKNTKTTCKKLKE